MTKAKKERDAESLYSSSCNPAIVHFIRKYCPPTTTDAFLKRLRLVLGQRYLEDIVAICSQAPYCLYLYHGVELEDKKEATVVLLGFFDRATGEKKIRLLDVFHPKDETANAICGCIADILEKFKIPLINMAIIYSNFPDHEYLPSSLKKFKSDIVSLCGLTDLAGQVCHSGVIAMEYSELIQNLITEIYKHFPSFPDALKSVIEDVEGSYLNELLTSDCSLFWRIIHKMTIAWSDIEKYFGCQENSIDVQAICLLLRDPKVRLNVLFLSYALQPLCNFQENFNQGVSVTQLLQDASRLLKSYTKSFLRPGAVEYFLRRGKASLVKETVGHLPRGEVEVGKQAADFLQQNATKLTDYLENFHRSIISFYTTVTLSIVKRLPFPDSTLRNLSSVLCPGNKLEVTGKVVQDLGVCFGVCSSPENVSLLTDEFLEYQIIDGGDMHSEDQSMEQYWKSELRIMGRTSSFGKLILSLLAMPRTLKKEIIFEQLFEHTDNLKEEKIEDGEEKDIAEDDVTDSSSYKSAPSHLSPETQGSIISDVIDLTEVEDVVPIDVDDIAPISCESDTESEKAHPYVSVVIVDDDGDNTTDDDDDYNNSDDDVIWTNTMYQKEEKGNISSTQNKEKTDIPYQDSFTVGEIVWGEIEGLGLWPGLVQSWDNERPCGSMHKVVFFGNKMVSEIHSDNIQPFSSFVKCFSSKSFATVTMYKDAIFSSLQVACKRSRMFFSPESDSKDELLRVMLEWAFRGFEPSGPDGLRPQSKDKENAAMSKPVNGTAGSVNPFPKHKDHPEILFHLTVSLNKLSESLDLCNGSIDLKKADVYRKLMYPKWNRKSMQNVKIRKRKYVRQKMLENINPSMQIQSRQNSKTRHEMVNDVLKKKNDIKDFCLSCGSTSVEVLHPLFEGSLCLKCRYNFTETLYRYDEDGYQSYCTVCCCGMEVILCGRDSCCRSFCVDCLDILVGEGTFNKLKNVDPWICYLCAPENSNGAMKPRHDWSIRVQEFFANNSAMEFEPHRVYPSIPANLRRPIRVLSLFDGIATGYLVLKDLGFKVEIYVASEVDEESVTVSMVNHEGKITNVDDVRRITKDHMNKWGPFDLLIGGSPCNDLSIVNPARKGLFEGTGRLFFEYYRLLSIMKPKEEDPRPFFWLYENVVAMTNSNKADICRFLECNPVLVDAVKVSPAHRARYFWGNIPGMNRPIIPSMNDKLSLQECLEAGRTANFEKVRTITTRTNSLKQGANDEHYPVTMNGKDDSIWITEMEKIFGFPKHYTDVKNMGRMQRQKVLGKSWSVPVIRHLFAPLKDYFACDEVPLK